ncbi:MAG: hypothetical protein ABII18_12930 [bacterium]|nr:hypothetical protein [bacterium]MBU1916883.1 hypothetical protein [bacterium]
MNLPERVKGLSNCMLVLHIFSKFLLGIGLGVVFAKQLYTAGWWIVGVAVVLSIIPCKAMFCKTSCCCSGEKKEE